MEVVSFDRFTTVFTHLKQWAKYSVRVANWMRSANFIEEREFKLWVAILYNPKNKVIVFF